MNILHKLNETLEARTTAALAGLDNLDAQLAEAIEQAERIAQERITDRIEAIAASLDSRLSAFTARITELASEAIGTAVNAINARLDQTQTPTTEQTPERTPETDVIPSFEEPHEVQQERTMPTVAAFAVECDGIAILDPDSIEPTTDDVPTVASAEGLHTKEDVGTGRARYRPAESPTHGETYYVRDNRRHWHSVRYSMEATS